MKDNRVDLTRRTFTIAGCNVCFDSREAVEKYLKVKWGINEDNIERFGISLNPDSLKETVCEVYEYIYNDNKCNAVGRITVSTEEQIESCMAHGWLE